MFLVAEALIEAGVTAGLPETVEPMVVQLLVGSSKLLAERGDRPALRAMVTSPGGTTAAGLRVLEERAARAPSSMPWRPPPTQSRTRRT